MPARRRCSLPRSGHMFSLIICLTSMEKPELFNYIPVVFISDKWGVHNSGVKKIARNLSITNRRCFMKSKLLIAGGVIQVLIVILHIGIFFGIASSAELGANTKVTSHIFNAAVTITVLFFAYVSLFRREDLLNTGFGRMVCWFIAVFYLQRGLVEAFLRGIDPVNIVLCLAIAALYILAALPSKSAAVKI